MKSFLSFIVIITLLVTLGIIFYIFLVPIADKEHYQNPTIISSVGLLPSRAVSRFFTPEKPLPIVTSIASEKKTDIPPATGTGTGFLLNVEVSSGTFISGIRSMTSKLTIPSL